MNHAAKLLEACLIASGADPEQARRAVSVVLPAAVEVGVIPRKHLKTWERDRLIYELRTAPAPQFLTVQALAVRFDLSCSRVKRIIQEQTALARKSIA